MQRRPDSSSHVLDQHGDSPEVVVRIRDLGRRFAAKAALESVSLSVRRGEVHGLVGANGAGKTTLIRHVLGLLRAEAGSVRVFDRDPVADPVGVLSRIGYLSEENDLPGWMRVDELLSYTRAFRDAWDEAFAEGLRQAFGLEPRARIGDLSKGQRARAGLLVALAYRPELLVLDEPSSGLDPIVRRDILGAILRTIADEGRTVLFSSHLLDEVERVADTVTMIREGRIVLSAPLEELSRAHRHVSLELDEPCSDPPPIAGPMGWEGGANRWTAIVVLDDEGRLSKSLLATRDARILEEREATLEEIFVARVGVSPVPREVS